MAGLIVELIISWLLLWIFCKQSILVLGIVPTKSRLFNLLFGFLIAAGCCVVYYFSFTLFANHVWSVNHQFTGKKLVKSSWWTLNSVQVGRSSIGNCFSFSILCWSVPYVLVCNVDNEKRKIFWRRGTKRSIRRYNVNKAGRINIGLSTMVHFET